MSDSIINIASGGSVVGAQIGKIVSSDVVFKGDWLASVTALRETLSRARAAGEVDSQTFTAAQQELDDATSALQTEAGPSSSRFLIALKKFRGLFDDASGIARGAASIIESLHRLQ